MEKYMHVCVIVEYPAIRILYKQARTNYGGHKYVDKESSAYDMGQIGPICSNIGHLFAKKILIRPK